jgi:hypothetical protein
VKHRICNLTGFGANTKVHLDNIGQIREDFADAVVSSYFKKYEGFDFQIENNFIAVGIEPSYQSDPLKIITIHKDITKSFIKTGRAMGYYGSGVVSKTKTYADYKLKCKFTKFVDTWHPILFGKKQNESK